MAFNANSKDADYLSKELGIPKKSIIESNIIEADWTMDTLATDLVRAQRFGKLGTGATDYRNDVEDIDSCLDFVANNTGYNVNGIKSRINAPKASVPRIKSIKADYEKAVNY